MDFHIDAPTGVPPPDNWTHLDWINEGGNSERQAATYHGEDGVAQVVVDGVGQRASSDVHGGLASDGPLLWVGLLAVWSTSVLRRPSIGLLKKKKKKADMCFIHEGEMCMFVDVRSTTHFLKSCHSKVMIRVGQFCNNVSQWCSFFRHKIGFHLHNHSGHRRPRLFCNPMFGKKKLSGNFRGICADLSMFSYSDIWWTLRLIYFIWLFTHFDSAVSMRNSIPELHSSDTVVLK